jgi:carbon storage regulator
MLVFTRKIGEQIQIGDQITITVGKVAAQAVRIGIEAPTNMSIVRQELLAEPHASRPAHSSSAEPSR